MIKSQKGFSLLEVMIAMALLIGVSAAVLQGFDSLNFLKERSEQGSSIESILSSQLDEIRANIANEKIDFKAEDFLNLTDLDDVKDSLIMRWNNNGVFQAADCPHCKGRIGYVIEPYKIGSLLFRGLLSVTIRVTHDELLSGRFSQYTYIVRGE